MTQKVRIAKEPTAAGVLARGAFRFLTGRPIVDGQSKTDATWTHKGSRSYGDRRASWWDYQTKTVRVGARLGGLGGVAAAGYGLAVDTAATLTGLHIGGVGAGSIGAAVVGYKATDAALMIGHNRDYVWPLHLVLKEALALPEGTRPRHYLSVPRDYNEITGDAIRVDLPPALVLSSETRQKVQAALSGKLAIQDFKYVWHTTGTSHHVVVRQLPRPPERADFAEEGVRRAVETAKPDAPVIGISHSGNVIARSIDSDAPHMLFIMGTNSGKSVMLRSLSAQLMHHGAEIIMLDLKMASQPYLRRIRGVRYAREIDAIHLALIDFGEEAAKRRAATARWIDEGGDPDKEENPYITHRLCLFFEEINSTRKELKKHWKRIRDKEVDPEESPAIAAFEQALNMGRSEKVHVIAVGQDGREPEIGPRINYGVKVMAKYDKKMWNLIAEAGTPPKTSSIRGRVQVIYHGETTETQGLFFTNDEAHEWATTGVGRTASPSSPAFPEAKIAQPLPGEEQGELATPEPASHTHTHTLTEGGVPGETGVEAHGGADRELPANVVPIHRRDDELADAGQAQDETADMVNMAGASKDKGRAVIPMNYDAIRQARISDPEFPAPDGGTDHRPLWKPETLQKWHRNRPRTASK